MDVLRHSRPLVQHSCRVQPNDARWIYHSLSVRIFRDTRATFSRATAIGATREPDAGFSVPGPSSNGNWVFPTVRTNRIDKRNRSKISIYSNVSIVRVAELSYYRSFLQYQRCHLKFHKRRCVIITTRFRCVQYCCYTYSAEAQPGRHLGVMTTPLRNCFRYYWLLHACCYIKFTTR